MMKDKLGLLGDNEKDKFLIVDLLQWMHKNKADYTNTFCYLMGENIKEDKIYENKNFQKWKKNWKERLSINKNTSINFYNLMRKVNPLIIPRNHIIENSLKKADQNNFKPINQLIEILKKPYIKQKNTSNFQYPSFSKEKYQTFCGT